VEKQGWLRTVTEQAEGHSSVFFSYSREDQARALPIIKLLEEAGFAVWWDGLLEGGERFSHTTEAALERAKAVVVLWSKTSTQSHWVHDEATRGRDRRVLVPLSLDGAGPPLGFGQFQVIDLSSAKLDLKDARVQSMVRAVAAMHSREAPAMPAPRPPAGSGIDRRMLIACGAAAVAVTGGVVAWQAGLFGGGVANNRIAILPFNNLSSDPKQAYLAEGLSTEIRSALSQNGALEVVGQASSEAFERGKQDPASFAKKLGAGLLIDGAVQVVGATIKVTIELINGKTGVTRPSRTFEKPMDDVLAVQREIAGAITAELASGIGAGAMAKKMEGGTSNVVAYDHYLRAKELYAHGKDEAEEREAIAQFEAAIAADPKFAAAHSGRARALAAVAGSYGSAAEIKAFQQSALASAREAIRLAPKLADAHSALALLLFQGNLDVKAARAPFDLSRTLGDGQAPVLGRFASYAAATGRDREASLAINRAILLDPLNALVHRIAGTVHYASKRYPDAIEAVRETIRINPKLGDSYSRIGMALLAQGKSSEALKEFEADIHKWSKLAGIAIAQQRMGNIGAAQAAMDGLTSDTGTVSLYQQGQVLAQWGETDRAVAALQKAYELRDSGMMALRYDPMLDPVRKQPGFIMLRQSMGFD
jgi:TolB-like protein/tetratricopeptide (TPR) repeat protein